MSEIMSVSSMCISVSRRGSLEERHLFTDAGQLLGSAPADTVRTARFRSDGGRGVAA